MLIEVECMTYNIRATGGEVPLAAKRTAATRADDVNAVTILVGTMTGTAELVANDMRDAIAATGRAAEVLPMDDLNPTVFQRPGVFLICSSTYGQGDVPDNAMKFYEALGQEAPDLGHVRYGVFALGDRTYVDTFCHGGKRFDDMLTRLKATRLGEVMRHDASAGTIPETVGLEWIQTWLADLVTVEAKAA
jgi:MioC protein